MRPRDSELARRLDQGLSDFENTRRLPGIALAGAREVLLEQILESVHRTEYLRRLPHRQYADFRIDPHDSRFDPHKAAIICHKKGLMDESCWLIFLSVHFGKHSKGGWRYLRDVYGRLGNGEEWTWERTSRDVLGFCNWLRDHEQVIRNSPLPGGFGNHRKYQSLSADGPCGTGAVVSSYVKWVEAHGGHVNLFEAAMQNHGNPRGAFDFLYRSMLQQVVGFGRLGAFDYVASLGNLGLAPVEAGSTYLDGATGPRRGARLLFGGSFSTAALEALLIELDEYLQVGMQVLEDSLCNWQKSPEEFRRFRA